MRGILKKLLSSVLVKKTLPRLMFKRGKPLYLAVAVHMENIHDQATFENMLEFVKALWIKPAAFVMTPRCPIIRKEMADIGLSEAIFTERLKILSEVYEIGMHGHYCRIKQPDSAYVETVDWMRKAGFERIADFPEMIREQFKAEHEYLSETVGSPETYCGGWWYMNQTIVRLLEEYGISADCSLRYSYTDSFGDRYMPLERMPEEGTAFLLPPSKTVVEFTSIAYLASEWWQIARDLLPILLNPGGPFFAVLPMHDYNLQKEGAKKLDNIRLLSKIRNVHFVSLSRMRSLALESGVAKSWSGFSHEFCQ